MYKWRGDDTEGYDLYRYRGVPFNRWDTPGTAADFDIGPGDGIAVVMNPSVGSYDWDLDDDLLTWPKPDAPWNE